MSVRILVVDDNRDLAENIGEILSSEGYEPIVCFDPIEAIELARSADFDAAVLDVTMPGMDGVALHAKLVELRPNATYLLMTAYTQDERIDLALAAGVSAVLTKPVPLGALLGMLPSPEEIGHVLLVDDDLEFNEALALALTKEGYRVRCASTVSEARSALADSSTVAVISDVHLPDGSGTDLAREASLKLGKIVILITGYEPGDAERQIQSTCAKSALLTKPFAPKALFATLRRLGVDPRDSSVGP